MRKIRITSEAGMVNRTKVYDAETGIRIGAVQSVSFGMFLNQPNDGFEGIMVRGDVNGRLISEKIQVVEMRLQ